MILTKDKGQRMWGGVGFGSGGSAGGGSGSGSGSAAYAAEAGHATNADTATTATTAGSLDANSTDWQKIADKTITQTIAEVWTFAKGIVSTMRSYFNGGATISKAEGDTGNALVVTGGTQTDTIYATGNTTVGGTLGVAGNTTVGGTLGVTGKLNGHDADFSDVTMDNLGTSADRVSKAWVTDIDAKNISTETLNVSKEAHFTKLVVDELLSNKGAIIISSANCVAEEIIEYNYYYAVFFSMTDSNGNSVTNPWRQGDLAICMTFKAEGAGTFADARNRYYWRKVTAVNSNVAYNGNRYHLVCLSKNSGEYEAATADAGIPSIGDNIVQLGYTGTDADYRQSAIILSAYPTMDTGITPPALAFYKGINNFSLSSHRYTYIDGLNNEFLGNFKILVDGNYTDITTVLATLEGLISSVKKIVRGKNILPLGGWTNINGELLGKDNYDENTQELTNASGNSYGDVLWSPIVFLPKGEYTFSCYTSETSLNLFIYYNTVNQQTPGGFQNYNLVNLSNIKSGDTYQNINRRYCSFNINSDRYVCLNLYMSNLFSVYRPMLENGNECTRWEIGDQEFSSQIKQTAESINIGIRDDLGQTGINISNHTIELRGNKVVFQNSSGSLSTPKISIDPNTGALHATDGTFEGTVRATNFYSNICLVTSGGTTNVGDADTVVIGGSGINTSQSDIYINLPAPSSSGGKIITIYGGQRISSLVDNNVQIKLKIGGSEPNGSTEIKTAWGTTGIISSNNQLRTLNKLVLRSNSSNWMILEWHNATLVNTTYQIVDVMQGLT